jgi:sulfate transport system ATP-binding protein
MGIHVRQLTKRFDGFLAVDNVSFEVQQGEMVALLGPSGGGKSTILRIIAGLETADQGSVALDGETVDHLPPRQRRVGFVFQHYALFRHMTVGENIAYGLRVKGVSKPERQERVHELLALIGLAGLEHRMPSQLSGGQRQRVALARSLAPKPRLLLLDEPFAAVDARVRADLRAWLRRLHEEIGLTSVFVTHDQEEAFMLADRVLIINRGAIEQDGTPDEVFDAPASEFVARFVGDVNVLESEVRNGFAHAGSLTIPVSQSHDSTNARVVIRPHDLRIARNAAGSAVVRRIVPLGERMRVEISVDGTNDIFAHVPRHGSAIEELQPGTRVEIGVRQARVYEGDKDK